MRSFLSIASSSGDLMPKFFRPWAVWDAEHGQGAATLTK